MHTGRAGAISTNSTSNPTNSTNSTDTSTNTITLSFSLNEGWNLKGTSYPINVSSFNKPEIVAVWKWKENGWQFWSPNQSLMEIAQTYGLDPITELNANDGFWVKTTAPVNISIPIEETQ